MVTLTFLIPRSAQSLASQTALLTTLLAQSPGLANPGTLKALGLQPQPYSISNPNPQTIQLDLPYNETPTFRQTFKTPLSRQQVLAKFGLGVLGDGLVQTASNIQETVLISPL